MSSTSSTADDEAAYAVYVDQLLESGHPHGEIAALHQRRIPNWETVCEAYEIEQFGAIVARSGWSAGWKFGFIERLDVDTHLGFEIVRAIGTHPAFRFLRQLALRIEPKWSNSSWIDPEETTDPFEALGLYPLPSTVRALEFSYAPFREGARGEYDTPNLYAHIPFIENLWLDAPTMLGTLDLPYLEWLTLDGINAFHVEELPHITAPALEVLELFRFDWSLLASLDFARPLRRLRLGRSDYSPLDEAALDRVVASPILSRVQELDLSPLAVSRAKPIIERYRPRFEARGPKLIIEPDG